VTTDEDFESSIRVTFSHFTARVGADPDITEARTFCQINLRATDGTFNGPVYGLEQHPALPP
jgi:hypothetical protein